QEMLAIGRELDDKQIIATALNGLGLVTLERGIYESVDYGPAQLLFEQSLALAREAGDRWQIAFSLYCLGILAEHQPDGCVARSLHEESLAIRRELGDKKSILFTLDRMAGLTMRQSDYRAARSLFLEMT